MITKTLFKSLILTVNKLETGISATEEALGCYMDSNWLTDSVSELLQAVTLGFFEGQPETRTEKLQLDTIEELIYYFIYTEHCGDNSDYCKSKLVTVSEDKKDFQPISCTSLEELYDVIVLYLTRLDLNFTFSYRSANEADII